MFLRHPQGIEALNVRHSSEDNQADPSPVVTNRDAAKSDETQGIVDTEELELVEKCIALEELVRNNIEAAQRKQCAEHAKKVSKGVKTFTFHERDLVLQLNARKKGRKGDTLSGEWLGPYTIVGITAHGQCTLQDKNRKELKMKTNTSQLKPYHPVQKLAISPKSSNKEAEDVPLGTDTSPYISPVQHTLAASLSTNKSVPASDFEHISTLLVSAGALPKTESTETDVPIMGNVASPLKPYHPIEPVPASDFKHTSTALLSEAGLAISDSSDNDVQFLGIVKAPITSFNERRTERSIRCLAKKRTSPTNATAYVGKVRFDSVMSGEMPSDVEVNAAQILLKLQFPHI